MPELTPAILLDRLGLNYISRPNRLAMCCPFHYDTDPSSGFYEDTGLFHCFACDLTFNVVGFYAKIKEISRPQAEQELSKDFDLPEGKKYDVLVLLKVRRRAEDHLQRNKQLPMEKHADLGETLDRILLAYERGQIDDRKLDIAMNSWYNRLEVYQGKTDARSSTPRVPGSGVSDGLQEGVRPVPRPGSARDHLLVDRDELEAPDGVAQELE